MNVEALRPALLRAAEAGTPAYVYFWDLVAERVRRLKDAFGGRLELSYAVKANPNRALLRRLSPHVATLDVSSGGEIDVARAAGYPASRLGFSGPAKTDAELAHAVRVGCGEVVVESVDEMLELSRAARHRSARVDVVVRVNPAKLPRGFGVAMAKTGSQFGIDEEELDVALERLKGLPNLVFRGFHAYAGTQCLLADALVENFTNLATIFRRAADAHVLAPSRVVFGAGFGIPLDAESQELDLDAVAAGTIPVLDALRADPRFADARFRLELGRYLVGEAGFYLTRVIRTKTSRGKHFCMCDGGLHHNLAAAGHFGSFIRRNYPLFAVRAGEGEVAKRQLVGPLCTTIDVLGTDVALPPLSAGDLVAVASSGAYGATASPLAFIHHPAPREVIVDGLGNGVRLSDVSGEGP